MTIEYIRYLLVEHEPAALIAAYEVARVHLDAAPECLAYDLAQCDDEPNHLLLRIEWTSPAGHMQGFRRGPHFPPFVAAIRPFIPEIAEMRHYTPRMASGRR